MIRTHIEGCKWGLDPTESGVQINLLHEPSEHMWHVPFNGEALEQLIEFCWKHLDPEAKRRIQANDAGIVVATAADIPKGNGNGH